MWWEEYYTQTFMTCPSEENAGSGWTRMAAVETYRDHPLLCMSEDQIPVSESTGLVLHS